MKTLVLFENLIKGSPAPQQTQNKIDREPSALNDWLSA